MILIADGGSTKVDWFALNIDKTERFKTRTEGLNPAIVDKDILKDRVLDNINLEPVRKEVTKVFFYGAGCGTSKAIKNLEEVFQEIFVNAEIVVAEDMLGAVYAASEAEPAIVCILGTGSNSCYFDGKEIMSCSVSLGWAIMDEASGNYFGKQLIRDYYYKIMPEEIREKFQDSFNLEDDYIKKELYKGKTPNTFLASHAAFMFEFKEHDYITGLIEKGVDEFFRYRVLPYGKGKETPIYFIGSVAFYFSNIIEKVANKYDLTFAGAIQRPIDNMINYHKKHLL
ncbi:N-acetylglucosamine kinase [Wenyingzhuangia sp. 2_MG-2023]|uniref:N-acetylglucosamine kinase n=1 Tax=Wenyingzhuangia sp. 2_MG-2023 TaxID=3062639 RepID=UPI0026E2DDDF|nr:N-acetylglucosamine kinase [Wenyingzhuangia sp. 2_MG-2023]MDO6737809.1 N-acetylglucosamine kinase [Wenyingzhuangia sp. 2_MG-2023]MDO6802092.1 N-acetylglucosamine kinase [Wenyingzhuangia sp. 1_MG-2023]